MRASSSCLAWLIVLGCSSHSSGVNETGGGQATGGATSNNGGAASNSGGVAQSNGGAAQSNGGAGTASGGTAADGMTATTGPDPKVNDCNNLAGVGVFEEITPPVVKAGIGQDFNGQTKGGTFAMSVDPVNQGTVYVGTLFQGVWKTTVCGSTWTLIASGNNAADVNRGMNWTFGIDPQEPEVVYTNSGYGSNGLFKSTDGGVNWTDIWSLSSQPDLGKAFQYNFANVIAIDPYDHTHLLLTFHEQCLAPHAATCIVESHDSGATWKILDGDPSWIGNEGQVIWFLESSSSWLWGSQSNGFWRSGDSGKSWQRIAGMETSHLQGSQILHAKDGTFYAAAADGIWRSPDGQATTWTPIPNTGPIVGGLISDGTTMYASTAYFDGFGPTKYLRSPETDGHTWEVMDSPTIQLGGNLGYDAGHKLLYSSNLDSGMWRIVVH